MSFTIDIKNLTSYFSLQGTTGETVYLPIKNSNITFPIDFNSITYNNKFFKRNEQKKQA